MPYENKKLSFSQIHIEVARKANNDFNPIQDQHRWQNIADNPVHGPIALGFELECLTGQQVRSNDAPQLLSRKLENTGPYVNYERLGVIGNDRLLFCARIDLMPLTAGEN